MKKQSSQGNEAPKNSPSSDQPDLQERLRLAYAELNEMEAYQAQPVTASSLINREPHLGRPVRDAGQIHSNSDHRIEDLAEFDMDIPIDFV